MVKHLWKDEDHADKCHERWLTRRNRIIGSEGYKDEWFGEQCIFCRFFVPLMGALCEDYGVCTNPDSNFDGVVRFEHDGCEYYSESEDWAENEKS